MNNYYAVDPYEHVAVRDAMLLKISASPAARWFALIDRGFEHGLKHFGAKGENEYCLYRHGRLERLAEVSPCLVSLSNFSPERLKVFLGSLLFHCRTRPMLSFIQSGRTGEEIADGWQAFLEVETDDAQRFLLRFADTRVLPALARCTKAIWDGLSNGLEEWLIVNRTGEMEALPLMKTGTVSLGNTGKAVIDSKEFACLLESGLPDALADQLHEHFPNLLSERGGAANYQLLQATCDLAKRYGLEAFPEQMALSVAVLFSQGSMLEDPQFESWMQQKPWSGGSLEAALGEYLEKMETTQ